MVTMLPIDYDVNKISGLAEWAFFVLKYKSNIRVISVQQDVKGNF